MGRNKIKIEKIENERNRQRKRGLIKKAMEISLLCEVKVMLCIVDKNEKVVLFSSEELKGFLKDYVQGPMENDNYLRTENYAKLFRKGKRQKKDPNNLTSEGGEKTHVRIPTYMKIDRGSGKKKKSKFFKNEKNDEKSDKNISFLIEDMAEGNGNNFEDILENIDNLEENENSLLINIQNETVSSKANSVYSMPSINERNLSQANSNVKRRKKGSVTPSETCNDSLNVSSGSLNETTKKTKRPSCFKVSNDSGRNSIRDSPATSIRELPKSGCSTPQMKIENPLLIYSKNEQAGYIQGNQPQPQTNHFNTQNYPSNFFPQAYPQQPPQNYSYPNYSNYQNYPNYNDNSLNSAYLNLLAQIGGNPIEATSTHLFMNNKRERTEQEYQNPVTNYEAYLELLKNRILYSAPKSENFDTSNNDKKL